MIESELLLQAAVEAFVVSLHHLAI